MGLSGRRLLSMRMRLALSPQPKQRSRYSSGSGFLPFRRAGAGPSSDSHLGRATDLALPRLLEASGVVLGTAVSSCSFTLLALCVRSGLEVGHFIGLGPPVQVGGVLEGDALSPA